MSNELLIVYNTCGINGKDIDRLDYYVECINSILNQNFNHSINLCISSCLNTEQVVGNLQDRFFDSADILWTKEAIPVNVTFNKAVQECVKKYGEFNGYCYIDSGIKLTDELTLQKMYDASVDSSNNAAMTCVVPDSDSGFEYWGLRPEEADKILKIPLGLATNLHCQIFSNEIFKTFDNRLMCDTFASYCTESVFSAVCASIKRNWIMLTNTLVHHRRAYDGPSACMNGGKHDEIFRLNKTIYDIFFTKEAEECGIFYEVYRNILPVNKTKFDNDGYAPNNKLRDWIKTNLFLPNSVLNYDNIRTELWHKK